MRVGFAGLGLMGAPMAANLCRAEMPVTVYNRSPDPREKLRAMGARVAAGPDELFDQSDAIVLMLADDAAANSVLGRDTPAFAKRVAGRLVINMGTHSPAWSAALARDIHAVGGSFVEAPVSGSRSSAEEALLVSMVAGADDAVTRALPILAAMCRDCIVIGAVPSALTIKLAVNLYLVTMVTALAEATHLARVSGIDLALFARTIKMGPMSSDVATVKLDKMMRRDFAPQASIRDVLKNARLIAAAADDAGISAPLLATSLGYFEALADGGAAALDMAAVLTAYEQDEPCA